MPTQVPEKARCLGCGYYLLDLPSCVCPECGRAFAPNDETTYDLSGARMSWRMWSSPPPLWQVCGMLMATGAYLYWSSWPPGYTILFAIVVPLISFTVVFFLPNYLIHLIAWFGDRKRASLDRVVRAESFRWRWIATPVCIVLLFSAWVSRWPLRVRFHFSLNDFTQVVEDVQAGRDPAVTAPAQVTGRPRRIGDFRVLWIARGEEGALFFGLDTFTQEQPSGLCYRPTDRPENPRRETRLAPRWFALGW